MGMKTLFRGGINIDMNISHHHLNLCRNETLFHVKTLGLSRECDIYEDHLK